MIKAESVNKAKSRPSKKDKGKGIKDETSYLRIRANG
jgi:hypothetical protein